MHKETSVETQYVSVLWDQAMQVPLKYFAVDCKGDHPDFVLSGGPSMAGDAGRSTEKKYVTSCLSRSLRSLQHIWPLNYSC